MRVNIKAEHFGCGGSGVTNFDVKQFPLYEEAVRRFGNPLLVVSQHPMPVHGRYYDSMGSLHWLGLQRRDLSDFWQIFEAVKKEIAADEERKRPKEVEIGDWKLRCTVDNKGDLRIQTSNGPVGARITVIDTQSAALI